MISKVFSGLTIAIAGTAVYFGVQGKEAVIKLQEDRTAWARKYDSEVSAHNKTKDTLKKTQEELEVTKADLESTRGKLRETEMNLATTKAELDQTKTTLAMKESEIADIKKILEEIGGKDAVNNLKATVDEMKNKIKDQEVKIGTLEKEKIELTNAVASLEGTLKQKEEKIAQDGKKIYRWEKNFMEKGTRGRVMAVNPGWGFAVISLGDKQGAASNKVVVVGRNGQSIGKLKITSVETNQSIADIIPGSFVKGAFVEPGDTVIFTGDDKVKTEVAVAEGAATDLPVR